MSIVTNTTITISNDICIHFIDKNRQLLYKLSLESDNDIFKSSYFKGNDNFNSLKLLNFNESDGNNILNEIEIQMNTILEKKTQWLLISAFIIEPFYLTLDGLDIHSLEFCVEFCNFIMYEKAILELLKYKEYLMNDSILEEKELVKGNKLVKLDRIYKSLNIFVFREDYTNDKPISINCRQLLLYAKTLLEKEDYNGFALEMYSMDKNSKENNDLYLVECSNELIELPYLDNIHSYYTLGNYCRYILSGRCLFNLLYNKTEEFFYEFTVKSQDDLDDIMNKLINNNNPKLLLQRDLSSISIYCINEKIKLWIKFIIASYSNFNDPISVARLQCINNISHYAHITAIDAVCKEDATLHSKYYLKKDMNYCNSVIKQQEQIDIKFYLSTKVDCSIINKIDNLIFGRTKGFICVSNQTEDLCLIEKIDCYDGIDKILNCDNNWLYYILVNITRKLLLHCNLKVSYVKFLNETRNPTVYRYPNTNQAEFISIFLKCKIQLDDPYIFYVKESS